jgi:hypothetical protein
MHRRILVLHDCSDASVFQLKDELARLGVQDAIFLTGDELTIGSLVTYMMGREGTSFTIRTADGRSIRQNGFDVVINRLNYIGGVLSQFVHQSDLDFAQAEIYALTVSLIRSFSARVINAPSLFGLGCNGSQFSPA